LELLLLGHVLVSMGVQTLLAAPLELRQPLEFVALLTELRLQPPQFQIFVRREVAHLPR
jgi:hypothetical protein